jgi:hypothetical protein
MTNLLGKHTLPSADQDRPDEEIDLVNQAHPPCSGRQVGAGYCQVMIDACLDLSDGLGIERALDPVRSVETSCSELEKTIFSARCQSRGNTSLLGDCAATLGSVLHPIIIS